MSWEYKKKDKWYKFDNNVQVIIENKYKEGYGYVDFIDDKNFPNDNLTIIFSENNENHEMQNVYNEDIKDIRRLKN